MKKRMIRTRILCVLVAFVFSLASSFPNGVLATGNTEPEKWYYGSDLTIDRHIIFGEDRMYTEGKSNRGFNCLLDNNTSVPFYVTTNDTAVNYQDLTQNSKEISLTFHTNYPVIIDHFKIISGGDTFKANYAHRSPTKWNLKAGNGPDSCDTVLAENLPIKATTAYEVNAYEFENTTSYKYYKFTITALAGAGRSGHDSPFSNPTATCILADILIGGPEPILHTDHDDIAFQLWNSTNSLPNTAGNYALTSDVTISSTWNVPSGTTNLCLNGHSITKTGNSGSVFYVSGGRTLNLHDCDTTTHYYDINSSTHLAENINTTSGTYSFTGGYITGGMGYSFNEGYRGGAGFIQGGTINIHGGAIVGNKASNGEGGGFYIDYGTLRMSGGSIVGNVAAFDGGGLQVTRNNSGFFYMTGGSISNNTASSHGGGLTAYNVADISGGVITGNQSLGGNKSYYKEGGGAIQIEAQGKLTISGDVEISGNKAAMSGGGILVWGDCSYFRLSGNPTIKDNEAAYGGTVYSDDNIRLNGSKTIEITGSLSATVPMGVSVSSNSNNVSNKGVFTSGWKTYMENIDPSDYFISDDASYEASLNSSGEAEIVDKPVAKIISGSDVKGYSSFQEALNNWSAGSTLKLFDDVTVGSAISVPSGTHTLDLNGYGIRMTGNGPAIRLNAGYTLRLCDSDPTKEHYITLSNFRGTAVSDTGTETEVTDGSGVVKITGGYITGGNNGSGGGGIYSGDTSNSGHLYITGVTFIGNKANGASSYGQGSAICAYTGGTLDLDGTKFFYNYAQRDNGGNANTVCRWGGTTSYNNVEARFNMGGGLSVPKDTPVSGKTIIRDNIRSSSNPIEFNSSVSTFDGSGLTEGSYIGIRNKSNRRFTTGNDAANYLPYCHLDLSITDYGIALDSEGYGIVGQLHTITYENNGGTGTVTDSNSPYVHGESVTVSDNGFTQPAGYEFDSWNTASDGNGTPYAPEDELVLTEDVVLYAIWRPHVHEWTYSANGNILTATCKGEQSGVCDLGSQTLTITAAGKIYDGQPVAASVTASDGWTKENGLADIPQIVYSGNTDVGTYSASITIDEKSATAAFTISSKSMADEVSAVDFTGNSDGNSHKITVSVPDGAAVKFGTTSGNYSLSESPAYTDAGNYTVYYQVTKKNYTTVTGSAAVKISPINATVTIVGNNVTSDYDGKEHTVTGFVATADTTLYDVTKDFSFSGNATATRTDAGTTGMGLKAEQFTNTNGNFKTVTFLVTDGYQKIDPIDAVVTVTGNTEAVDYDGSGHTVTGYTATVDTTLYDVTKDFTFSGNATATRTDAGTTSMGLKAEQFANTNGNFKTVTFLVNDGSVTIRPINATVTITGNNATADYDGEEHTVTGYTATADTALYDVTKDFTFSGDATATRTDAGATGMGLKAEQFTNTNGNFNTVTFLVTDGYQKVDPVDATVTIVGNNATADYDGKEHTVTGYTATADTALYDVTKDFSFSGNATVARTDAGLTAMGLTPEQFTNTNGNFKTVVFLVTDGYQKIDPIDAVVTITGKTEAVDYDGKGHTVTDFVATADTPLYDVTKDFTFSGDATAIRIDAGTTEMGLKAEQFINESQNFKSVTFLVTDGSLTVRPINATVTVTGNNAIVDYDGKEHTVTGYTATADTVLYDVTKDLTFSGKATVTGTDVGTAEMGLKAEQFANVNENFKTVTFLVTDGYQTISSVDAVITTAPRTTEPIYNGKKQELILAGKVDGGTLYYALGTDAKNEPDDGSYSTAIPSAKEIGSYFIWYKVKADSNHRDLSPAYVKTTLAEEDWVTVSGTLYQSDGKTPLGGATVTVMEGNRKVDEIVTDEEGRYQFTVPTGVYSIVAEHGNSTETSMVTAFKDTEQTLVISDSKTESILKVNDDEDNKFGVAVGGLNEEARAIREADHIADDQPLSVVMTVEPRTQATAANADSITLVAKNKSFVFFDTKIEKTVNAITTVIDTTANVLEIAVPYAKTNKRDLAVYSSDGKDVRLLEESDSKAADTFYVDKENGLIYIYANRFSTFAIGYTPYFRVESAVTLGSFKGTATIMLTNQDDASVYKLENVALDEISFADIPKGAYTMTVTWEDGAINTLTMPVTVS